MQWVFIMKKHSILTGRRGFTLTEVLLAVMIVGLIGVALAALTRSASREAGVGRSRIMLRNNLATFMRTLRADLAQASSVKHAEGPLDSIDSSDVIAILQIVKNADNDGEAILSDEPVSKITYCFQRGTNSTAIQPSGAYRGGKIYRTVKTDGTQVNCATDKSTSNLLLSNVKYIPTSSDANYPVPLIGWNRNSTNNALPGLLKVHIITELDSTPVVNETIEETFSMPVGIGTEE